MLSTDPEIRRIMALRAIESGLLRLRWLAAATRFEIAMRRHDRALKYAYKYGYNPNQPRVPRGQPEGGRWTQVAGEVPSGSDSANPDQTRLLNRHIMQRHVGKSDEELKARLQSEQYRGLFVSGGMDRNGSFASAESARELIGQTIKNNSGEVSKVASGEKDEAFLTWEYGRETGREAYLLPPDPEVRTRTTSNVGVLIVYDRSSNTGYRVVTAYPRNYNPRVGR
jgi:hypothetical protein